MLRQGVKETRKPETRLTNRESRIVKRQNAKTRKESHARPINTFNIFQNVQFQYRSFEREKAETKTEIENSGGNLYANGILAKHLFK